MSLWRCALQHFAANVKPMKLMGRLSWHSRNLKDWLFKITQICHDFHFRPWRLPLFNTWLCKLGATFDICQKGCSCLCWVRRIRQIEKMSRWHSTSSGEGISRHNSTSVRSFSEMESRGLTSLEEGVGKKSQWSLWEQADKISGFCLGKIQIEAIWSSGHDKLVMKKSALPLSAPGGSVVTSIYSQEGPLTHPPPPPKHPLPLLFKGLFTPLHLSHKILSTFEICFYFGRTYFVVNFGTYKCSKWRRTQIFEMFYFPFTHSL